MKKILSVLLASLLLLSTSATAFAMETETNADNWLVSANQHQIIHNAKIAAETGQNVTLTTKILSDLSDNHFELVEVGDTGYMIFDPQSGKYLEEALDSPSPYLGLSENLYYFGPLNYYQLSGDKFVHTVIHNEYDMSFAECRSLQSAFDTALQNSRTQKDTEVLALMQTNLNSRASVNRLQSHFSARATNKYIPNYKYIKNAIYPANENNTCGYTAACLILNYWHKVKGNVIDSSFLDSNGNLKTTGNTLQDKLLSYGKSNSSWGLTIRDVLIDYCNEYGVAATSTYYVTNFDIFAEVGRNRPVIVFGYFPDSPGQVQSRGKVFHAVTAYGTSTSGLSCYQSYREGKYTKEEYVQLRKTNQELLADLENQISDLQEKAANQEPDTEEKIEQLTQYSMLEQYDGDVLSNIIDKVLIYNDKDIEVVFKGENFIRNAV